MGLLTNCEISCDDMMQELAEASVESILVGTDAHDDSPIVTSVTPPMEYKSTVDWFAGSEVASTTPYSTHPSWSFSETEVSFNRDTSTESVNEATTVMLRNIPNKYTRAGLLAALVERGFDNPSLDCNNLYLPMDAGSGCNLGYAFLNFTDHVRALEFKRVFDGCRLPSAGSRKVCTVVWANKQGLFQHSNPPAAPTVSVSSVCKVFVGGLPSGATEADVHEFFSAFGQVRQVSIVINRQTGASRGFGFCEFDACESVDRVQEAQARKPLSINCRVITVRPYTEDEVRAKEYRPEYTSFYMGNGILQPTYPDSFSY